MRSRLMVMMTRRNIRLYQLIFTWSRIFYDKNYSLGCNFDLFLTRIRGVLVKRLSLFASRNNSQQVTHHEGEAEQTCPASCNRTLSHRLLPGVTYPELNLTTSVQNEVRQVQNGVFSCALRLPENLQTYGFPMQNFYHRSGTTCARYNPDRGACVFSSWQCV